VVTIELFEALSPSDFPALSHLEIRDSEERGHAWRSVTRGITDIKFEGRLFRGLLRPFLFSLNCLVSLWVDESCLLPGKIVPVDIEGWVFWTIREIWGPDSELPEFVQVDKARWRADLHAVLSQLESLRVGFGAMDDTEVGLALSCCDETKLRHFGFDRAWKAYGADDVGHLAGSCAPF
jgi:hypothetical protein